LKLKATPLLAIQQPMRTDPFVWIVSPPVPVHENAIVEVSGFIRIDEAFDKSGGLVIMDTIGGPELSLIVRATSGWQTFRLVRAVPNATELRLTFSLTGVGTAQVDGVAVRVLQQPEPQRLPAVSHDEQGPSPMTAEVPASIKRLPKTR
jgi:hypothetical protein